MTASESDIAWVTGAAGFIGRHVCRALADSGWTVVGIGRGSLTEPDSRRWGLARFMTGTLQATLLDAALADRGPPGLIVHAAGAGSVGESERDPMADFHDTVGSTALIADHARRLPAAPRIVCLSSAAVYGDGGSGSLREDQEPRPISSYGWHKLMAETLCAQAASQFGLTVRVVRFFSVFGAGQSKLLLYDIGRRLGEADGSITLFGHGGETRDYVSVDAAAALVRDLARLTPAEAGAIGRDEGRFLLVNGGTGRGRTVREVATALMTAMGRPADLVFTGRPRAGDPGALVADTARLSALGLRPAEDFDAGIQACADWLKAER